MLIFVQNVAYQVHIKCLLADFRIGDGGNGGTIKDS